MCNSMQYNLACILHSRRGILQLVLAYPIGAMSLVVTIRCVSQVVAMSSDVGMYIQKDRAVLGWRKANH